MNFAVRCHLSLIIIIKQLLPSVDWSQSIDRNNIVRFFKVSFDGATACPNSKRNDIHRVVYARCIIYCICCICSLYLFDPDCGRLTGSKQTLNLEKKMAGAWVDKKRQIRAEHRNHMLRCATPKNVDVSYRRQALFRDWNVVGSPG